jgi:hypothetical protein
LLEPFKTVLGAIFAAAAAVARLSSWTFGLSTSTVYFMGTHSIGSGPALVRFPMHKCTTAGIGQAAVVSTPTFWSKSDSNPS